MPLRTPPGHRDIMPAGWKTKEQLRAILLTLLQSAGCSPVSTPAIEYYQTYADTFDDPRDSDMYKFFDQNGEILVLRMDMTVPIARAWSTKFPATPQALCYCEDVFKVRQSFRGRRSQVTDCGAEFIGYGPEYDHQVLELAATVLEATAPGDWTLEISDIRLFQLAAEAAGLPLSLQKELAALIDAKSLPDLSVWLDAHDVPHKDFFLALPLLSGGREALLSAMALAFTPEMEAVLSGLDALLVSLSPFSGHISLDLAKTPHLNYYTGLLFEGFVQGSGFSALSGGRYDNLLEKFGTPCPATGFSVKLDYLMDALEVEA